MDSEKKSAMAYLVHVLILAITIPLFSCIVLALFYYLLPGPHRCRIISVHPNWDVVWGKLRADRAKVHLEVPRADRSLIISQLEPAWPWLAATLIWSIDTLLAAIGVGCVRARVPLWILIGRGRSPVSCLSSVAEGCRLREQRNINTETEKTCQSLSPMSDPSCPPEAAGRPLAKFQPRRKITFVPWRRTYMCWD